MNLSQIKFGYWEVLESSNYNTSSKVNCRCVCGKVKPVAVANLLSGRSRSCGCMRSVLRPEVEPSVCKHALYPVWKQMHSRCSNPNTKSYKNYGALGVKVCPPWSDFEVFLSDVGERPFEGATLDRIDNSKGYEPGNVRWATRTEQARNKRVTVWVTYKGQLMPLADLADIYGVTPTAMHKRLVRHRSGAVSNIRTRDEDLSAALSSATQCK